MITLNPQQEDIHMDIAMFPDDLFVLYAAERDKYCAFFSKKDRVKGLVCFAHWRVAADFGSRIKLDYAPLSIPFDKAREIAKANKEISCLFLFSSVNNKAEIHYVR